MALQPVCLVVKNVVHTEVLDSYLGTGSTWCTLDMLTETFFILISKNARQFCKTC